MLINGNLKAVCFRFCLLAGVLLMGLGARAQDAVYVLKAGWGDEMRGSAALPNDNANAQSFDLYRNLIFFSASMDGKVGNFILDTGAPGLLINDKGQAKSPANTEGLGSGGTLALGQRKVESLEFAGQRLGKRWALTTDLRAMEERTGRAIDGFVGYDVLRNSELRIDYLTESFSLLKSTRTPLQSGEAPTHTLKLDFVDHLPVVTLKFGKRKLRFVIDTGAGTNLIDPRYISLAAKTGEQMNIQGLDGNNMDCDILRLPSPEGLNASGQQMKVVSTDLSHLQEPGERPFAGILGSSFLSNYCVGIDYRRRRVYLWTAPTTK